MIVPFSRRAAPFSRLRFGLYISTLACISLYSLYSATRDALRGVEGGTPERQAQETLAHVLAIEAPAPAPQPLTPVEAARDEEKYKRLTQLQIKVADARAERGMLMSAMLDQAKLDQAKHPGTTLEQALKLAMQAAPFVRAQAKVLLAEREYELGRLADAPRISAEPQAPAKAAASEAPFTILRLGRPVDEIRRKLPLVGLPSFLQRLGATGAFTEDGGEISIEVVVQGRTIGRYVERLVPIDADRSKLFIDFVPADAGLLADLVASLQTPYDPPTLMRVVMFEHTRSTLAGESFNLRVLDGAANGSGGSFVDPLNTLGACPVPRTDDFPLCDRDR